MYSLEQAESILKDWQDYAIWSYYTEEGKKSFSNLTVLHKDKTFLLSLEKDGVLFKDMDSTLEVLIKPISRLSEFKRGEESALSEPIYDFTFSIDPNATESDKLSVAGLEFYAMSFFQRLHFNQFLTRMQPESLNHIAATLFRTQKI